MKVSTYLAPVLMLTSLLSQAQTDFRVVSSSPKSAWKTGKGKKIEVGPIQSLRFGEFKQLYEKRYGGEEGFNKAFLEFLSERMGKAYSSPSPDGLRLELISLQYQEAKLSPRFTMYNKMVFTKGFEWTLKFRLMHGADEVLGGEVSAADDKADTTVVRYEYNPPNRLRLPRTIEMVQERLVDFVTGNLPDNRIEFVEPPKMLQDKATK